MVKTTVYLDAAVALKLKRMADSQGRSQAELIRESLARLTGAQRPPLPKGLGKFASGNSGNAANYRARLRADMQAGKWK